MRTTALVSLGLAVFGLVWLGPDLLGRGADAQAAPAAAVPAPVERTIDVDGVERAYLIHVPASWDRRAPIALLLVFHGAGSDAESMVKATGFEAWAETEPTLIVYPRARRATKRFDVDGTRAKPGVDVRFVDVLLERLKARFPLDLTRIYATGFSNGGAFCYRLAADRATTIAAIAPVGGYLPATVTEGPQVPVPTLHVHGTDDRRVPPPLTPDPARLDAVFQEMKWILWNTRGRPAQPWSAFEVGGLQGMRLVLGDPAGAGVVQFLLLAGEGHVWSGGRGGPVSREIWTFLRAHPRAPATAAASAPTR
jgi:polyhydroxybutyrate depolymerase